MAESAPWWQIVHERFKANGISVVVHVPDAALVGPIGAYRDRTSLARESVSSRPLAMTRNWSSCTGLIPAH